MSVTFTEWACRSGDEAWQAAEREVQWLVPVARAYCIAGGRNFVAHKAETAHLAQNASAFHTEFPMGFIKLPGCMVPTRSQVRRPDGVAWFDYEIEPAAVIGKRALDVRAAEARQHAACDDLIFGFEEMVAHWSRMGLGPGTLISTGSPEGVAISRKPDPTPFFLKPGDVVEAEVPRIGTLVTFIT